MSRYIEYHDICSAIDNQQDGTGMTYEALAHAMVEIQLAPSIDICFCKECISADEKPIADGRYWCNSHGCYMRFCSDGERGE